MIFRRGGLTLAVFAALLSLCTVMPSVASARGHRIFDQALAAAQLRPDQQAHISQLMADERARAKSEPDKSARRADKKQLHQAILATLDPNQRAAFEGTLRQLKAERKAARHGGSAPPPVQQGQPVPQ